MSYIVDLDEYTDAQLKSELEMRASRRRKGLCDYCNRPPDKPSCKFPSRHALPYRGAL